MPSVQMKSMFSSSAARPCPQHWSVLVRNLGYVLWVFTGFIGLAATLLAYGQYRRMTTWLPAHGTVTQHEVYWEYSRNSKGGSSVVYGARFTFRYTINGQQKVGVADLGYRSGFRSWIAHEAELLPVGTSRDIRVDPNDDSRLSLAADYGPLSFAAAYSAFSLALVTFALGLGCRWGASIWREADERRRASLIAG